ncbi:NAD(P)-dependent oxidoreductase [Microbacteriaceae bacterium 4G12]
MRIAFLGLGRMGRILARHVLDDGHDLHVWNRTAGAADELGEAGAAVAASAAEAVDGADVVITALFGPDAVRAVVAEGNLPFAPDAVWLDITTIAPADAAEMAEWAAASGVRYVHSPVIGSLAPARNRALGVVVGGEDGAVDRVLPLVRLWAEPDRLQRYPDPAKAATGKLVANLALAVGMQGLVEAVTLGNAGGLSPEETLGTLKGTALGMIAGMKGQNVLGGRFDDTQFSADLLAKDARLMVGTSPRPLVALTSALAALQRAQDAGLGDHDFSVIATEAR